MQEREKVRPGEGLKVGRVEVVVPATVDEEVEAINGDQIRERVLIVHSTQWHYSHWCSHFDFAATNQIVLRQTSGVYGEKEEGRGKENVNGFVTNKGNFFFWKM